MHRIFRAALLIPTLFFAGFTLVFGYVLVVHFNFSASTPAAFLRSAAVTAIFSLFLYLTLICGRGLLYIKSGILLRLTLGIYWQRAVTFLILINFFLVVATNHVSLADTPKCLTRADVAGACFTATPKCLYIYQGKVYGKGQCTYPDWQVGAHNCSKGTEFCHECGTDTTNAVEFINPTNQIYPPYAALCAAVGITDCTIRGLHEHPLFKWFANNLDGYITGETPECPGPTPTPRPTPRPSLSPRPSPTPTPSPVFTIQDLRLLLINYLGPQDMRFNPQDNKTNLFDAAYIVLRIIP